MHIDPADIAACLDDELPRSASGTPMAAPIVQTSLFSFDTIDSLVAGLDAEHETHVYSRGQNPTVEVLEEKLARLERGEACKCFASGMAAVSAVMLGTLRAGDHILFVNHTYGPTLQLAAQLRRFGIEHDVLLDLHNDAIARALRPNTRLVWLESPGTMLFRTMDVQAAAAAAHGHGAVVCLDNSWATPLFQKPLEHGVDIVVHSCSKYIGGHSDVMAGAVITAADRMREIFYRAYMLNGGILAPFDAWLLLRGLRTLPVRMRQHHENGLAVAEWIRSHDRVKRIFHPAFADQPAPLPTTLTGFSGLFSFELGDAGFEDVRRALNALRVFRLGVSWGGVESIAITPNRGTNDVQLSAQRIPHGLIRLSVGLEPVDMLIADLDRALAA
jgi:cystathionine beta-lyase/cystathionine gamma-synthase